MLRESDARHGWERGSARGQMQKLSAGKFHFEPPSLIALFDHPIGYREQAGRERDTECLGGAEIDDKFKLGRLQNRQSAGLAPLRIRPT